MLTLTDLQIDKLYQLLHEHDVAALEVEGTNLPGVIAVTVQEVQYMINARGTTLKI